MASLARIAVIGAAGVVGYAYLIGGTVTQVGGDLNPSTVPAAYAQDIEQAGTVCPAITAALIAAQINQESGFDKDAESDTGAEGIAQFEGYNSMVTSGEVDPWNPASAIHGMAELDCDEYKHFGSVTLALAAYNAGEGNAENWQDIGQTRNYVESIEAAAPHYAGATTTTTTESITNPAERISNGLNTLMGDL